ncbi:DNA mismatch repair endonuclease MutL [uncultured Clostridium sp.]|uniref:DNA mismatch repair endonuclease MutL n=1 Tax=uncultured Clostridium sp. TaxID=59620 RepID=UPI002632B333|nr:DNA mismatch repair endonuclease MutL [uncultured Clostridium sp.]
MGRINVLDQHTSNQIAAGEVVERPSSVVKELVENSIDAGSKNITIEIEEGGTSLIKIIDDGVGIFNEDVKKAFLPHATSKIQNVDDIFRIDTLGFRGEALPSIAAISKVNMKSKTAMEETGWEVNVDGGTFTIDNEVGVNNGTVIEVRDLFFNVPARKKFLKSSSREGATINDIVSRIALAHPDISFKLFNNSKQVVHTYGTGNLLDSIRSLYGKNTADEVLYFEYATDTVTIHGYIGKDTLARKSRNNQTVFVNKRYIKNRTISVAVENAYKSFNTGDKYPFFVLFIDVYPEFIDVNVHPTKSEIKFRNDREVFSTVFKGIHDVLSKDIRDEFNGGNDFLEDTRAKELESEQFSFEKRLEELNAMELKLKNTESLYKERVPVDVPVSINANDSIVPFVYSSNISEDAPKEDFNATEHINTSEFSNGLEVDRANLTYELNSSGEYVNESTDTYTKEDASTPKFPVLDIIGQYNKTYIIAQKEGTLYLVDQHAAHEKFLFEKYLKSIERNDLLIQPLMVPLVIELSLNDYGYYEENKDIFENSGFKVESFGMSSIKLSEVPYFLGKLDAKGFFLLILDNLKNLGSGKTVEVKYNRIATLACKAAVKANDILSDSEMKQLLYDIRFLDDPFHCPHGRPTIIKFTSYEMDKMFKRIV